jgi:hypothetical protein
MPCFDRTEHLRQLAERMLALAMKIDDPKLAEALATRAGQYLDEARALESTKPPIVETLQRVPQQAEQLQPDKSDDPEQKE